MDKWDDRVELPDDAKQALAALQRSMSSMALAAQRKPIKHHLLIEAALEYLALRRDQWAAYGSWAWNHYFPSWLQLDPSDLDIKLLRASTAPELAFFVQEFLAYLPVRFHGHDFVSKPSIHNGTNTLLIYCDRVQFMDISLLSAGLPASTMADTRTTTNVMSLEWMLADLAAMLELPTAAYRRQKDLRRLGRLYNCAQLNQLLNHTPAGLAALGMLHARYQSWLGELCPELHSQCHSAMSEQQQAVRELEADKSLLVSQQTAAADKASADLEHLRAQLKLTEERAQKLAHKLAAKSRECTALASKNSRLAAENKTKTEALESAEASQQALSARVNQLTADLAEAKLVKKAGPSKPPPSRKAVKAKSKPAEYDPDKDISLWKHNCDTAKEKIVQLLKKNSKLEDDIVFLTQRCEIQGERANELLSNIQTLSQINEQLAQSNSKHKSRFDADQHTIVKLNKEWQLALASFVRCQTFFQMAIATIFWQNAVQLILIDEVKSMNLNMLVQMGVPKRATDGMRATYCNRCYSGFVESECKPCQKFALCIYDYNKHVFDPDRVGSFDYDAATKPYRQEESLGIRIPWHSQDAAPVENGDSDDACIKGVMLLPLMPTKKIEGQSPLAFIDGRQVFIEDESTYWTLCPECLVQNIQELITRNHLDKY